MIQSLEKTHQLIDRVIASGLGRLLDAAKINEVSLRLSLLLLHNRILFKHSDEEVRALWQTLRTDEELMHVVVNAATSFSILYEMEFGEGTYHALVELVGRRTAECCFTTMVEGEKVTMVDHEYSESLYIDPLDFTNLLKINAWLVFLLVLENTCYPTTQRMVNIMASVTGELPADGKEKK